MRTILLTLAVLVGLISPARAYSDCASGPMKDLGALLSGGKAFAELVYGSGKKARNDVYKLLAYTEFGLSPVAKFTISSSAVVVINCAALENADAKAAALRKRLAESIGEKPRKVTAARVQAYYLKRLKGGTPGQKRLLSDDERQLWADVLAYAAVLEPKLADKFAELAEQLQLPAPQR